MKYSRFYFIGILLIFTNLFGQEWKKQLMGKNSDSVLSTYSWFMSDEIHSAFGELKLAKVGRFIYSSHSPLHFNQFSEGSYLIKKDTLILNSDLQADNVKVRIEYIDTTMSDTMYKRLYYPENLKGEIINRGYYQINEDSSFNGRFDPMYPPANRHLLNTIKTLKVKFDETEFGTNWIPILRSDKYIKVIVLIEKNFNDYQPLVLHNYKFVITRNKLIDISKEHNL